METQELSFELVAADAEWRNPFYPTPSQTLIDVELNRPDLGRWVPFTANPDDVELFGRELYAIIITSGVTIQPYVPPALPEEPPYSVSVEEFWTRMTDAEAESFDAAMWTAPPLRLRRAFNAASSLTKDTELFGFVKDILTTLFGAKRSSAILASN
jgi:hypothetical protein